MKREVPSDPQQNLEQLKSILAYYQEKIQHLTDNVRPRLVEKVKEIEDKRRELGDFAEDADLGDASAANREQIQLGREIDLERLDARLEEFRGKAKWVEHTQIPRIEEIIRRKGQLRFRPFEKLAE